VSQNGGDNIKSINFQLLLEAYRQGWQVFWRYPLLFLLIMTVADIPLSLIRLYSESVENSIVKFLLGLPLISVVTPFAKVAAVVAFGHILAGKIPSFIGAYTPVLQRLLPLLLAVLLWSVSAFLGVIALVVGTVIVLIGGQFIAVATVIEKLEPIEAAKRSWSLVKPHFFIVLM
jgi:hypothetical protein